MAAAVPSSTQLSAPSLPRQSPPLTRSLQQVGADVAAQMAARLTPLTLLLLLLRAEVSDPWGGGAR